MNKKAALQLSINAIVILILAITILSLGLGFIKGQFGALTERFSEVSSEIKSELINKIKDTGELLVFNRVEIEAKIGKPEEFYIGIKNTAANEDATPVCFIPSIKCVQALKSGDCPQTYVGGTDMDTMDAIEDPWFSMFRHIGIKTGEVGVYPVTLQIARSVPDTYLMEFNIYTYENAEDCETGGDIDLTTPYQTKQFFIKLS